MIGLMKLIILIFFAQGDNDGDGDGSLAESEWWPHVLGAIMITVAVVDQWSGVDEVYYSLILALRRLEACFILQCFLCGICI